MVTSARAHLAFPSPRAAGGLRATPSTESTLLVPLERVEQARADVAGGAEDDDPHRPPVPVTAGAKRHNGQVLSPAVDNLVAQLTKLPGVGQRTAQRLAFHLLSRPKDEALALAGAIEDVKERVRFCRSAAT